MPAQKVPPPPTKRKSCSACVKGKRKCGMELPRCARCMKKDIPCYYPHPRLSTVADAAASVAGLEFSWLDGLLFADGANWNGELQPQLQSAAMGMGMGAVGTASSTTEKTATTSDSSNGPSRAEQDSEMLRNVWDGMDLQQPLQSLGEGISEGRSLDEGVFDQQSQANAVTPPIAEVEPDYLLQTPREVNSERSLSQSQTDAALHRFRTWPHKWVKEGKAPFINPRLYSPEMPKALQDAYAACAIYSVKTKQNEAIAFTVIESKANELVRSYKEGSWTPLDLLAALQALVIFQFIRLFDGDIRQRAQAEAAQVVLQAWTDELEARTELERTFTTDTAPSWRSWIFAESVRRTIVMSLNLAGVYSYLFSGFCTFGPRLRTYAFTAQRWLWEARSSLEWDRVKQSQNAYWVTEHDFNHVLQEAQEDELDEFGVMMLIMVKGQDYFDDWIVWKHYTRPPVMDLHIGKTVEDLVQPLGDAASIAVN